jgi:hypothetical protein
MPIEKFYTMEAFAAACERDLKDPKTRHYYDRGDGRKDWYSNETNADTARLVRSGDTRAVERSQKLLHRILDTLPETERPLWQPSPCGAFPIVPEVLSGHPTPMRARRMDTNASNPVRLWVVLTSSAGVPQGTLQERGAALMALLSKLSEIRPVEMWAVIILDGKPDGEGVAAIRLPSDPLSTAHCAYALTSSGFTRGFGYDWLHAHHGSTGSWPRGYKYSSKDDDPYLTGLKRRLGGAPHDLIIEPAKLSNARISSDPAGWVNDQIRAILTTQENN